jgi:hypothetical protein
MGYWLSPRSKQRILTDDCLHRIQQWTDKYGGIPLNTGHCDHYIFDLKLFGGIQFPNTNRGKGLAAQGLA